MNKLLKTVSFILIKNFTCLSILRAILVVSFIFYIFILTSSWTPSWAQEKPERILTLSESIKLATNNNQELLVVSEQENIANSKIKLAKSQRYPKIIFSGAYTNLKVNTPVTLSPALGGTTLDVGISQYYTTNLSLRQFLYTGGYLFSVNKEARLNLQEVESDYRAIKRKIVLEVTNNFYNVLLAEKIFEIYENALAESKDMLELTKKQSAAGQLYEYSFVNAEVQLAVINASLEKARQDLEETRIVFNKSVGIELNTTVKLDGELVYNSIKEFDLNKTIVRALQFDPELNRKKIEEEMYDIRVSLSKGKLYPSVIMGGDISYSGEVFPPQGKSWTATVAVSFPIFDGWASWTRVKEAKSELRKTKLERVDLNDEIKLRIKQIYSTYERTKKAINPLKQSQELCKKSLNIAVNAFKEEKISFVELLSGQITSIQMQINYVTNLHNYLLSEAELNILTNPVE